VNLPERIKADAMMIEDRGPDLCRAYRVKGEATIKANKKDVLSQLMVVGLVE